MAQMERDEAVARIRKTQENFALAIGFVFAITLSIYFFTYAMLTDKGYTGMLWFEGISAVVMVVALMRLKQIAFFCTRLLLGRRAAYRELLASMGATDRGDA